MDIPASQNGSGALQTEMAGLTRSEEDSALSFTNGLLTAVIVAPSLIPPEEWMPFLIDDSFEGLSAEQIEAVQELMMIEYRSILDSLAARDGSYEPYFCEDEDGSLITKDWAEGFLAGIELGGDRWARVLDSEDGPVDLVVPFILLQDEEFLGKAAAEGGLGREESLLAAQAELPLLIQQFYDLSPHGALLQ
jgi:yecA family protein